MSEISLSRFDPRYGNHIHNAVNAIENKNPTYAIDVCSAFLFNHPECLEVIKILWKAQLNLPENGRSPMTKVIFTLFSVINRLRGWVLLNHPEKMMIFAEGMLKSDPYDIIAYRFLARAAVSLQFSPTSQ